jgi:hypothetical protein
MVYIGLHGLKGKEPPSKITQVRITYHSNLPNMEVSYQQGQGPIQNPKIGVFVYTKNTIHISIEHALECIKKHKLMHNLYL